LVAVVVAAPMFPALLFIAMLPVGRTAFDVTALFNFAAGLAAFLFILVTVLIFLFIYDNLRRGRKAAETAA
jgi:uncharacterized membrane protein